MSDNEKVARAIFFSQWNIHHDHDKHWNKANQAIWLDMAERATRVVLDDIREWCKSWPPSETPIDKAIRGSFKRGIDAYAKERDCE